MKYEELLRLLENKLNNLKSSYKLLLPDNSWVTEAIDNVKNLIIAKQNKIPEKEYFNREELLYQKTVTSLSELHDLNRIISFLEKVDKENLKVYLKKLKIVFNAPLLLMNENSNSNEPRNIMFELRFFSRFKEKEYATKLCLDHPDILVNTNNNEYAVECKRIFQPETLIDNTKDAINQLLKYSLNEQRRYGVVALSITRFFHSGNKRFEAKSENAARLRLNYEMRKLVEDNKDELLKPFTLKIPLLILEYSDCAVIDKPYNITLHDFIETANGRPSLFYKVLKDFNKFNENLSVTYYNSPGTIIH